MKPTGLNDGLAAVHRKLWIIAAALTDDRAMADDIVQDAIVIAIEKKQQFQPGTNLTAWLSKIVRLTALNHIRKQQRRNTYATDPDRLDRNFSAERNAEFNGSNNWSHLAGDQEVFDDAVVSALESLSGEARACLLLRTIEDLPYAEIAELLEISEGTAMSHVHRAKGRLRRRLKSQFDSGWVKPECEPKSNE